MRIGDAASIVSAIPEVRRHAPGGVSSANFPRRVRPAPWLERNATIGTVILPGCGREKSSWSRRRKNAARARRAARALNAGGQPADEGRDPPPTILRPG